MLFLFIPEWLTVSNFLIGLFGLLTMIGGTIVVLLLRAKSEVGTIQIDRANAAEALVKTKDAIILGLETKIEELEEELESVTAEHRTIVGIEIAKLMAFWAQKESFEAEMEDLKHENRVLRLRKDGTTGEQKSRK